MGGIRRPGIFLSHNRQDKPFARRLASDLQASGVQVWIDEAEIRLGDSLLAKIEDGITSTDFLAVILSPSSIESEWVRRELDVAMNQEIASRKVKVLPLLYRECKLPAFLAGKLYADFTKLERYHQSLRLILDRVLHRDSFENDVKGAELPPQGYDQSTGTDEWNATRTVEVDGFEVQLFLACGTVVRKLSDFGSESILLKVRDNQIEQLRFPQSLPAVSVGDQLVVVCGDSFISEEPIPLFWMRQIESRGQYLTENEKRLVTLGLADSAIWIRMVLWGGIGFAVSMLVLGSIMTAEQIPPGWLAVSLFLAPLLLGFGMSYYMALNDKWKIDKAKKALEDHVTEMVSGLFG